MLIPESQNAAGNTSSSTWTQAPIPDDRWNSNHFLDTAELSAAYGIAYDWFYDIWTDDQKAMIRATLIQYGLSMGVQAYTNSSIFTGWWDNNIEGNWNCVCNNGLTMGSLAILGDDTTGFAKQLLGLTVDNAKKNCAFAVSDDGTWSETADYWYFGATGHAEMASSLMTATGSDYDLLTVNPDFSKTGLFHMYGQGATSLFNWGVSILFLCYIYALIVSPRTTVPTSILRPRTRLSSTPTSTTSRNTRSSSETSTTRLTHGTCFGTTRRSPVRSGTVSP